jgi:L-alanine-DL-glutamate epimerase-like enolase superfamily enzyme
MTSVPPTASAASASVKIDRIEVFPVRYPTVGYFKFFETPWGALGRAAVILKVTADNGTFGWGQSVPVARWSYETLETATVVLKKYYGRALIGHDPRDIVGAHHIMDGVVRPAFSTGMPISRAGLDVALHDLAGKLAGKSLAEMWGRPRGGPILLSWTLNPKSLDDVDGLIDEGRKRGYRHFNIKVAPDPKTDLELARRVKRRVPDGFLWADANGGYDPSTALATAPELADAGVDVLEAPIPPNHLSGYQALKRQGALPILMDEGVVSPVELEEFIKLGMLDGVAMKHSRCGGLLSAKRQIELLMENGLMWLGSGLADPDISLAATLALFGAFGLKKPAALNGPQFLAADVLKEPFVVKDATIEVPQGPGLGIEVDEENVRELVARSIRRG